VGILRELGCLTDEDKPEGLICSDGASLAVPMDYNRIKPFLERISMDEGDTPIFPSVEIDGLFFKDETRNPTGSFRDRAAPPSVADLFSRNVRRIVVSGDGNTCASYAAYSARAGVKCTAVMPEDSDVIKVEQVRSYGCNVILKGSTMDETHLKAHEYAGAMGWEHVVIERDPYALTGLISLGMEIAEAIDQYGFQAVIVPVGSGATLSAIYTAFKARRVHGVKLIGVQAGEGSYASLFTGIHDNSLNIHYSIRYLRPLLLMPSYRATLATGGWGVGVPLPKVYDEAIVLAEREGVFAEPAAVASYIVARELSSTRGWRVLVVITSTGLKTVSPRSRFFIGETKLDILRILKEHGRLHGYLIWKILNTRLSPQAVYSSLKWLEERGFVVSIVDGRRKLYSITDEGLRVLEIFS
jgi:threonine synthase